MKIKALIDGDILVYRCGYAAEHTKYVLEEAWDEQVFWSKKALKTFIKEKGLELEGVKYTKHVEIEPLGFCLHSVKATIHSILERVSATDYTIYLTGKDNFRDKVATIQPYKGNRDKDVKPVYYKDIRDYLVKNYNTVVVDGMEADDAISIAASEFNSDKVDGACVVVSIDKDLHQIPGSHYNWVKDEFTVVTFDMAVKHHLAQILAGDSTDNIQGIPGIGYVTAEKMLDKFDIPGDENHPPTFDSFEAMKFVNQKYCDTFGELGNDMFNETCKLVTLLSEPLPNETVFSS